MSDFEALRKLVKKITALEDSVQEIPVDDNVVKDDNLVAENKNLVEAMYNSVMGSGLGIKVNAKLDQRKLSRLAKNLKRLATNQEKLQTQFHNPRKLTQVKEQIQDVSNYVTSLEA